MFDAGEYCGGGLRAGVQGEALAVLGRKVGLTSEDFEVFQQVRDTTPVEAMKPEPLLAGRRRDMLAQTFDGLMGLFRDRVFVDVPDICVIVCIIHR